MEYLFAGFLMVQAKFNTLANYRATLHFFRFLAGYNAYAAVRIM